MSGGPNPDKKYDCCYEEYDSNTGSTLGVYCADCWKNEEGSYTCNDYVKVLPRKAGELLGSNVLKELKEGSSSLLTEGATNDTSNHIKSKLNVQELSPLTETNNKPPLSTSGHPSDEKTGKSQKNDISSSSDVSSDTRTDEGSKTDDSSNKHRNDDLKERISSSDVSKDNASP